ILAKTIHSMADDIKRVTKKGGLLLLSGLITKTVQPTVEIFENLGFTIQEILEEEEWHAIIAKRD
ncbi:MAG: 50S ribosomal protein L11 methyltransferase, partial [Vampirovibrionia bacterium]